MPNHCYTQEESTCQQYRSPKHYSGVNSHMAHTMTKPFISCVNHSYAETFVKRRINTFRKDLCICLRPDEKGRHAYMPGLMTCISLLELLSGLFIGKLNGIRLNGILRYTNQFMDSSTYTDERISILYEMFRHKIAHITQPYGIFDTYSVRSKKHVLRKYPRRRITWQVNASNRHTAIVIYRQALEPYLNTPLGL
jgi:hypothetical protein